MSFISDSLNRIKPSATMVITAKATQLKREGKNVIGLSSGEPDFDTPQHVKQAAIDAINKGYTKYTNIEGIPELRQSIVEKISSDSKTLLISEIPWPIDPIKKDLIETDLSGSTLVIFLNFLILFLNNTE